jgi:hypothetical protein
MVGNKIIKKILIDVNARERIIENKKGKKLLERISHGIGKEIKFIE